jgi:steroid delta-isomerase-like uncharacterized protein
MSEANKTLMRRWFDEVWNQGLEQTIDEMIAKDCVVHGLGETETDIRGPEEFKVFVRNLRGSFPDVQIRVEDLIAEDERIMARVVLEATHTGQGMGLAPTGQRVRVAGIVVVHFANGRSIEAWNVWDQLGLLRQMGAMPSVERRDRFLSAE